MIGQCRVLTITIQDYKQLTMTFKHGGVSHTFQGLRHSSIEALTDKELSCLQGTGFLFQIFLSSRNSQPNSYSLDLAQLLAEFKQVFEVSNHLPPKWSHDHCIPLQPNVEPVSVRPYRYPYHQKAAIEKMVTELLQSGLIRPSNKPFSSPVLLVKKVDGDW